MTQNKKSYIGLTIGPIIETISNAKQTGELWARSYLFSYIMKNIIKTLIVKDRKCNKEENKNEKLKDRFILPCIKDISKELNKSEDKDIYNKSNEKTNESAQEVGLFHDRFIFQSEDGDFNLVKESIDEVIDNIVLEIENYDICKDKSREKIKANIKDFLKIYYLEIHMDLSEKEDKQKSQNNIIFKVNRALDGLELREKILNNKGMKDNYLLKTLSNKKLKEESFKSHFLSMDAYGEKGKKEEYPCLFKIALDEINNADFPNEDEDIKKKLRDEKLKDQLIKANEYVAVVQVDGDSMGKMIDTFKIRNGEEDIYKDYKDFSRNLLKYDKKSHEKIKEYDGFTVYAGGDDLLFIAPVIKRNTEGKSKESGDEKSNDIFNLIDGLSDVFNKNINAGQDIMANSDKPKDEEEKPTTSFGVAIVHHKCPLYYALDEARELLFNKAKNYKFNGKEKNAIAFKVIKSSGQSFGTVVGKKTESYYQFKNLFKKVICLDSKNKKINNYLKAIHFKLMRDKVILNKIGESEDLLQNYFDNNFDEKVHKTEPIKTYLSDLKKFIWKIYSEAKTDGDKNKCIEQIYTYLRFIRFMDEDINKDD